MSSNFEKIIIFSFYTHFFLSHYVFQILRTLIPKINFIRDFFDITFWQLDKWLTVRPNPMRVIQQMTAKQTWNEILNRFPGNNIHENSGFSSAWGADSEYRIIEANPFRGFSRSLSRDFAEIASGTFAQEFFQKISSKIHQQHLSDFFFL